MLSRIKKAIKILIGYNPRKSRTPEEILQSERVKPWFADEGDTTLRLHYDLNQDSIVFDVGGYKGEFATDIFCKYNSTIYIFEPIKGFYDIITRKFWHNDKVRSFNFGLSGKDEELHISLSDNSSSVFLSTGEKEKIILKSIVGFLRENQISKVDLIKINIEGGEYGLLEALIESNLVSVFKNIQVQFHDFIIENAKERMQKIQRELSKTHQITYQYEFVWENWKLK